MVSVVVLTCDGKKHLDECLSSLLEQSWPDLEIILVVNGSSDGSAKFVRQRFHEKVNILELPQNLGYTGGNNKGIEQARGEYICLLNDDTRVDKDWVRQMAKVMQARSDCGLIACKILSYYEPEIIDNVGHIIYRDGTFRGRGRLERDRGQYDRIQEVLSPSGCAMMIRASALKEVGAFDDDFFIYGDDAELSMRFRLAGWRAFLAPKAVVYHKYSASTGAYSPFKAFLVERNRIWLVIKYFPLPALLLAPFFALGRICLQTYGVIAGKGASGEFARQYPAGQLPLILIRAHWAALKGVPRMWKKRRGLKNLRKVKDSEFYRWVHEYGLSARELALKK